MFEWNKNLKQDGVDFSSNTNEFSNCQLGHNCQVMLWNEVLEQNGLSVQNLVSVQKYSFSPKFSHTSKSMFSPKWSVSPKWNLAAVRLAFDCEAQWLLSETLEQLIVFWNQEQYFQKMYSYFCIYSENVFLFLYLFRKCIPFLVFIQKMYSFSSIYVWILSVIASSQFAE